MKSLCLDQTDHDLFLDANGNIAICSEPYSIAQDVATALRTFQGECWYDLERGVPYMDQILGRNIPLSLVKATLTEAAMKVPLVADINIFITGLSNRVLQGQVSITAVTGDEVIAVLAPVGGPFILNKSLLGGGDLI